MTIKSITAGSPFAIGCTAYAVAFFLALPYFLGLSFWHALILPVQFLLAPVFVLWATMSGDVFIALNTEHASHWAFFGLITQCLFLPGLLAIAFFLPDRSGYPPLIVLIGLVYRHPARSDFELSVQSDESSPMFDADVLLEEAEALGGNTLEAQLKQQDIEKMLVEADRVLDELSRRERRQVEAESEQATDIAELARKIEEIERLKARISARKQSWRDDD